MTRIPISQGGLEPIKHKVECRTGISSIRLDHDIQGKVVKGSMFKGGVGRTLANKSYAGVVGEAFPGRDVRSQP